MVEDPWSNKTAGAAELRRIAEPVNFQKLTADNKLLLMGIFGHPYPAHMAHMGTNAVSMAEAGITRAIVQQNGMDTQIQAIKDAKGVLAMDELILEARDFFRVLPLVQSLTRAGIDVSAMNLSTMPREFLTGSDPRYSQWIADHIAAVAAETNGKVAVFNMSERFLTLKGRMPSPLEILRDQSLSFMRVMYASGGENFPISLLEAADAAGKSDQEFMLDIRPYQEFKHGPMYANEADYLIHLPKAENPYRGMAGGNF